MNEEISIEATKGISKAIGNLLSGPISEMSELIADQVRYFRWRALVRIAERAKEIRLQKGVSETSIPLKVLLPILEEGSKEDETNAMCEKWANLLASIKSEYNSFDLVCVDFLKKISAIDADIIDALGAYREPKAFRDKLKNEVLRKEPTLGIAIEKCNSFNPDFSERNRAKYFNAVKDCLEDDLQFCWHELYSVNFEEKNNLKSQLMIRYPETLFALKVMGLINIDYTNALNFNPDFSFRYSGRGAHKKNGKWANSIDSFSVHRLKLTQIGELFWRKVSGN